MIMKAKVIKVYEHHGWDKTEKEVYVYRGWYSGKGWTTMRHARHGIRQGSNITDITEDSMFNLSKPIETIEEFVEHVEDSIKYYKTAYPNKPLQYAYDMEGGFI